MAAGSGAIRAGRAFIELFTEDSAVGRGLRAVSAKMAVWGASVNKLGSTLGSGIGTTFGAVLKGAKIAGIAVAGMAAGLGGLSVAFAGMDRSRLNKEQATEAGKMEKTLTALKDTAMGLNAAFQTALGPTIRSIIDIVRMGMNAFRGWIETHRGLLDGVNQFVKGVRDALSAGDLAGVVDVVWSQIKLSWATGVAWVMESTLGWKTSLQQTMSEAFLGLQDIAGRAWGAIADFAAAAADSVAKVWERTVGLVARGVAKVGEFTRLMPKGTSETLREDQARAFAKSDGDRARRADDRVKSREKENERRADELGQSVLDANRAIAEANRRAVDESKAELARRQEEFNAVTKRVAENAKPIETGLAEARQAVTTSSAFGGGRSAFAAAADVAGKSIADNTRETAKNTKTIATKIGNLEPGLGVT